MIDSKTRFSNRQYFSYSISKELLWTLKPITDIWVHHIGKKYAFQMIKILKLTVMSSIQCGARKPGNAGQTVIATTEMTWSAVLELTEKSVDTSFPFDPKMFGKIEMFRTGLLNCHHRFY